MAEQEVDTFVTEENSQEPDEISDDEEVKNDENNDENDDDDGGDGEDFGDDSVHEEEIIEAENDRENNGEMYIDELCKSDEEEEDGKSADGLSDELFSKVLSDLIHLKSRNDLKKKKSPLIPSVTKFLNTSINKRSITRDVKKNMLNLCQHVHRGKVPVTISTDSQRFLRHFLDKRTPKEDVNIALSENLIVHSILREAIDLINTKK